MLRRKRHGRWTTPFRCDAPLRIAVIVLIAVLQLAIGSTAAAQQEAASTPWQPPALTAPQPGANSDADESLPPSTSLAELYAAAEPESLPHGNAPPSPAPAPVAAPPAPFAPPPPPAQPAPADLDAIMKRLEELEQKVAEKAEEKEPAAEKSVGDILPEITWTDLSAEKWTVKPGAQMQLDSINWADHSEAIPAFNYVEFRRLRLMLDGVGYGQYDFRVQMEFEPESNEAFNGPVTEVRDAYFSMNDLPAVYRRARIGHFFVPFGLEQVTNDVLGVFLERSIPANGVFTGERKTGFAFYGVSDDMNTTWTNGFFIDGLNEATKERIDDNQGQRISARVTHLPYYDEPSNGRYLVHTGAGVMYTHDQDNIVRFRTRPDIHEGPFLIDTLNMAADNFVIGNLELATVWGPWAMQSEAFYTTVDLDVGGLTSSWGAYVHSSYFLTGENRTYERFGQHGAQFGRVQPYSNFFFVPGGCGPGAWEMKARWSTLSLTEYNAGQYNDFTFGFNWYWSPNIRVMFDWIHPFTSPATVFGETQSDIIGMRFDFNT
jgi:phosphate-selective porin OprO/OprP